MISTVNHVGLNIIQDVMNLRQLIVSLLTTMLFMSFLPDAVTQNQQSNQRPKLGLVLSGGGAKGFAHIGVLKVFEEAGLCFDYIGGTSMGSVVGSLYALGYHPDSIAQIVRQQDWNAVMNDKIPRNYIPIEEKQNYDRFVVTFPVVERKVQVKSGLHNGQLVNLLLAKHLSPAFQINDFSHLPTPFLCIGTDLSDGKNIVLESGVLHKAVRASMSIPGYFTPTVIDGRVLVDGGVINNYPVAEVKAKGADIIIGVDVQTGLHPTENLTSIFTILDQVTSFYRISNNELGVSQTDIYIKPDLGLYDMMSFEAYEDIMLKGEIAARAFMPQLKKLADSLERFNGRKKPMMMAQPLDSVFVTFLQYNGLKNVSREFVDGILEIEPRSWVKIDALTENLKRAFGSGFFEVINYHFIPGIEGVGLVLNIEESSSGFFGAGLHYDNDYKASLLLNATFKNVGLKGSKVFIDLNLGENPLLKGLYLVDRGSKAGFGLRATTFNLKLNSYQNNNIVDVYNSTQYSMAAFLQWTFQNTLRIRSGVTYENIRIKSNFTPDVQQGFNPNLITFFRLSLDTYNKNQFPTSGNLLDFQAKHIHNISENRMPGFDKNIIVFSLKYIKNIPISDKHTFRSGFHAGFTIQDRLAPIQHWFILGGQSNVSYFDTFIPFTGLRFIENAGLHTAVANFSWQYNFYQNFYATLRWDLGLISNTWEDMLSGPKLISGYGVTFGYESIIGPFELSLMGSNVNKGLSNFINIGYWF